MFFPGGITFDVRENDWINQLSLRPYAVMNIKTNYLHNVIRATVNYV